MFLSGLCTRIPFLSFTYTGVSGGDPLVGPGVLVVGMGNVVTDDVNAPRDDESEELFARPQWPGFEDGRLGHAAVP